MIGFYQGHSRLSCGSRYQYSQIDKAGEDADIGLSRPWEFHPQPLAELDVNLSAHPAPIIQSMVNIPGSKERGSSDFASQSFPIHKLLFVYVHLTVGIFFASILPDTYSNVSRQRTLLIHRIDYHNYASLSVWNETYCLSPPVLCCSLAECANF
jgi:hypothetical protein